MFDSLPDKGLLGVSKPTHFRCEVCNKVYPIKDIDHITEHVTRDKKDIGSYLGRAALITKTYSKEVDHFVCKECKKKDERYGKMNIIVLCVFFAIGLIGGLILNGFNDNLLVFLALSLVCWSFASSYILPKTKFIYKSKITDYEIFMAECKKTK